MKNWVTFPLLALSLCHTHPHAPHTLSYPQTHNLSPPAMLPCEIIGEMFSPSGDPPHHTSARANDTEQSSYLGVAKVLKRIHSWAFYNRFKSSNPGEKKSFTLAATSASHWSPWAFPLPFKSPSFILFLCWTRLHLPKSLSKKLCMSEPNCFIRAKLELHFWSREDPAEERLKHGRLQTSVPTNVPMVPEASCGHSLAGCPRSCCACLHLDSKEPPTPCWEQAELNKHHLPPLLSTRKCSPHCKHWWGHEMLGGSARKRRVHALIFLRLHQVAEKLLLGWETCNSP